MQFEWDPAKAAANRRKHKVDFSEAQTAFRSAAFYEDAAHSTYDDRYIAIGFSEKGRLLTVAFTVSEETIRIISARGATAREARQYGQTKQQTEDEDPSEG